DFEAPQDALRAGVEGVVGTPGRILDLYQRKTLRLDKVSALVLHEADEMFDLGFLHDVAKILAALKDFPHQTMLFSATMPGAIVRLARTFMNRPVHIRADAESSAPTHASTQQIIFQAHRMDKLPVLSRILQVPERGRTLVFTRTK